MDFLSGRSRSLVVAGSWIGKLEAEYMCTNSFPSSPNRLSTLYEKHIDEVQIRTLGMLIAFSESSSFSSWPSNSLCSNVISDVPFDLQQTVKLFEWTSEEIVLTDSHSILYDVFDGSVIDEDVSAEWTISADVEEWFEVVDPIEDSDLRGFPNYGGSALQEDVTGRRIRFFEKLKSGGTFSVSIAGKIPLTHSLTITQEMVDTIGEIFHGIDRRGLVRCKNSVSKLSIPALFGGEVIPAPYTKNTASSWFDASVGYELEITKGLDETGESYGYSFAEVKRLYDWRPVLFCFDDLYPDEVEIMLEEKKDVLTPVAYQPGVNLDLIQNYWSAFAQLDGVDQVSEGEDERAPIRCWISSASLSILGDDTRDWRLLTLGRKYPFTTLQHKNELLDDGSSLSGWSSSGVLSSGVGTVRAVFSGAGSLTRTFTPAINSETFRFLSLSIMSTDGGQKPFRIVIGNKTWNFESGNVGQMTPFDIDLCQPHNVSQQIDEKEVRYPLDLQGNVVDSAHWGVSLIDSLTIEVEEAGIWEVDEIQLEKKNHARVSFCGAQDSWVLRQAGQSSDVRPFFWSEVDGRVTNLSDMSRDGTQFSWKTLQELGQEISQFSGWQLVAQSSFPDAYHTDQLPALFAGGNGKLMDGTYTNTINLECSAEQDIDAQSLWDEVEIYGGAGDVWNVGGAYGGETNLRIAKHLRGQAWGLVLTPVVPESGKTFSLKDSGGGDRGSGLTDAVDHAITRTPWGHGNQDHFVEAESLQTPLFTLQNRMRHRRVLLAQMAGSGPVSLDWHADGSHVRASLSDQGRVEIAFQNNNLGGYEQISTELVADWVSVRLGLNKELILVIANGGDIEERVSYDKGENWTVPQVLASGNLKFPSLAIHPDGRRLVYWVNGTQVDGVLRDQSGQVLQNISGARTGVDDLGLAVQVFERGLGKSSIELITVEGGSVVSSVSSDGANFS